MTVTGATQWLPKLAAPKKDPERPRASPALREGRSLLSTLLTLWKSWLGCFAQS